MDKIALKFLFPMYCTGSGVSYTCLSLAGAMRRAGAAARVFMCAADHGIDREIVRTAVPEWLNAPLYRAVRSQSLIRAWTELRFVGQAAAGDIAYLWPGVSLGTYRKLRQRGCTIVVERINCHRRTARRALDEAYRRCGMAPAHGLTDTAIDEETRKLDCADFIFSPSPLVAESLRDAGVGDAKIIPTSYGWDPQRHAPRERRRAGGFTALFVGRLCVRKGVHLLLEVWKRAAIPNGRLVLAGFLEPELEKLCGGDLQRADVEVAGFVSDVAGLYAGADVFVFPSLEEGGPQVTYEAMACGLPVLVSPMGAGAAARDGLDGCVRDPYDADGWAGALRELAADAGLRGRLGDSARERAGGFVWDSVGRQRLEALAGALERGRA